MSNEKKAEDILAALYADKGCGNSVAQKIGALTEILNVDACCNFLSLSGEKIKDDVANTLFLMGLEEEYLKREGFSHITVS